MALDPDLVQKYSEKHQIYTDVCARGLSPQDPEVLEAQEQYREALAAYLLDLEVNGMSLPDGLEDQLKNLSR